MCDYKSKKEAPNELLTRAENALRAYESNIEVATGADFAIKMCREDIQYIRDYREYVDADVSLYEARDPHHPLTTNAEIGSRVARSNLYRYLIGRDDITAKALLPALRSDDVEHTNLNWLETPAEVDHRLWRQPRFEPATEQLNIAPTGRD